MLMKRLKVEKARNIILTESSSKKNTYTLYQRQCLAFSFEGYGRTDVFCKAVNKKFH
jgi:hypothetical protein